jgi:2-C-methyl-D-erythritol 4-phosphate cytidylyltransferase/2-C-methyl-D-erythritol 2,4-cyclodiphosphate synthase
VKVLNKFQKMGMFGKIVITAHKDEVSLFRKFTTVEVVSGGKDRQESIQNGLQKISSEFVMISDIARCDIPLEMVNRLLESRYLGDVIVPYLPVSDTVVVGNSSVNRDEVKLVQTPQLSKTEILKELLKEPKDGFTDESSLFPKESRYFVLGDKRAEKLTFLGDMKTSFCFKADYFGRVSVGNGFDVHQFSREENRDMVLGGVEIDTPLSFKAHSDGDVVIHSVIDALLGGAGIGDIGELFPDSDEVWKNANSMELLKKVANLLHKIGLEVEHVDITIIAQIPRIGNLKMEMKKEIAKVLEIQLWKVNVKATTTEKLGFIGRKEGLGVLATATIQEVDWRNLV